MDNQEYAIINKTDVLKRIEELENEYILFSNKSDRSLSDIEEEREIVGEQRALAIILSKSTPLIPEIEKAMNVAREIKDDSAHDTFTAEDISGCTEVCTYGWKYKTTNEDYISNLKLDI